MWDTKNSIEIWEKRWQGSENEEKLTFLGKLMFGAKLKVMSRSLKGLDIKSAIEVGSGLGYTLSLFEHLGYSAIGIDISETSIKVCKNKGLHVRQQSLETVRDTFDLVSSDGLLEHFLNFEPYAMELMRISEKYVLLIQPNHDSFRGKTIAYFAELTKSHKNVFEYNYRIKDFIKVFSNHGFDVVANKPVFFNVFRLLLFKRKVSYFLFGERGAISGIC